MEDAQAMPPARLQRPVGATTAPPKHPLRRRVEPEN